MAAMFTLYLCIRFLTSATSGPRADESRLYRHDSGALHDTQDGCSHCRLFARACPLLGLLTAGLAVVAGAWVSDGRLWRWSSTPPTTCSHCEGYEENRRQAEEADEKVRQADRSKQQFMAYVFHNIRGGLLRTFNRSFVLRLVMKSRTQSPVLMIMFCVYTHWLLRSKLCLALNYFNTSACLSLPGSLLSLPCLKSFPNGSFLVPAVPFNAIVLGLGHIRALGDGGGVVGSGADKMDLVQMMLDCAETMTSVLDDVTDMGEFVLNIIVLLSEIHSV